MKELIEVGSRSRTKVDYHLLKEYRRMKSGELKLVRETWVRDRLKLKPRQRAVLDALLVDWRTSVAAKIAGVSRNYVVETKKQLVSAFAEVYTAWKRR